jgi:hypothetical protein
MSKVYSSVKGTNSKCQIALCAARPLPSVPSARIANLSAVFHASVHFYWVYQKIHIV